MDVGPQMPDLAVEVTVASSSSLLDILHYHLFCTESVMEVQVELQLSTDIMQYIKAQTMQQTNC
jgi:hypothetical protein